MGIFYHIPIIWSQILVHKNYINLQENDWHLRAQIYVIAFHNLECNYFVHFLHSIWNIVFSLSSACKKVRAIIILLVVHTQSMKEDQVSSCILFMFHYEGRRRFNLCVNLQVYERHWESIFYKYLFMFYSTKRDR